MYLMLSSGCPGVKCPGPEAEHKPPPSVEVKNACIYISTHPYFFMAEYFVKHGDNFTCYVYKV